MNPRCLLAALCLAPLAAAADARSGCKLPAGASMRVVEYFNGPPTLANDLKCDGHKCSLKGWLYLPRGVAAGSKAVVFLHGHAQDRHEACAITDEVLGKGWVVFAPVRRGHNGLDGDKKVFSNTGMYIDDWAKKQPSGATDANLFEAYRVRYAILWKADVELALRHLAGMAFGGGKLINPRHIGLIGHSYGGILSLLSADGSFKVNPAAIVDIAGAELSWGEGTNPWKSVLEAAVKSRRVPIYFLQPRNGKSTAPTAGLSYVAASHGNKEFQAAIFPAVQPASSVSAQDVHEQFIGTKYVPKWAPSVRDFFDRYF